MTFVSPLKDQINDQDTQWSPKPRKFPFCITSAVWPSCLPWTSKSAVVAQELPWLPNGGTVVATVIAQWSLFVSKRRHSGGIGEAEALLKLINNVCYSTHFVCIFMGNQWPIPVHPFCDHGGACVFLLRPCLSDLRATDLLGELCATVLNMQKNSQRPWCLKRGLNVQCATLEWPFGLLCAFNGDLASLGVAHGRDNGRTQPLCKGGIIGWITTLMTLFEYVMCISTLQLYCNLSVEIGVPTHCVEIINALNSLWPNDTIWRHGSWSTLAQVMARCLTASNHYLNQCWLIISNVLWHSSQGIIR